jgi:hypothetical protein
VSNLERHQQKPTKFLNLHLEEKLSAASEHSGDVFHPKRADFKDNTQLSHSSSSHTEESINQVLRDEA